MKGAGVIRADALHLPLADESVDLIITSPPYFALRSYRDGGDHYDGQIGSEPTPQAFLQALWAVTAECWRVLKPTGSLFVNLGDKRSGSGGHNNNGLKPRTGEFATRAHSAPDGAYEQARAVIATRRNAPDRYNQAAFGRPKSKMLLPHRFAIGCEDGLADPDGVGWIVRQDKVWNKPNCLSGGVVVYAEVKGRPLAIKVHDLCRAYRPEDVRLWNGERWTQVVWWQPTGRHPDAEASYVAIRAARSRGNEPVVGGDIEVELRSGERIGCTREHRWPTQRGLVTASDLVVGDVLDTAPLPEGQTTPAALDDEMVGWFVGLYIAEGSRSGKTIQIAGHVNELERYKRLCETAEAFHGTCHVYPAASGNGASINMTGSVLASLLTTYVGGSTAKDKHLLPKVWQRSNRFLRAVLDGYLSGDGSYESRLDRWSLRFTANDYLASDLRTLAARLGISVRLRRGTVTGFGKEWPAWLGTLYMDRTRRRAPDSQVVAIRQSRARQFWDIGVADDPHLFSLASGVLTHNSLPESVTDRVRDSHEYWFHLVKQGRYFSAVDEVRDQMNALHPLGKTPGSVWTIPSEPLRLPDYFLIYPDGNITGLAEDRKVRGREPWSTAPVDARRPSVAMRSLARLVMDRHSVGAPLPEVVDLSHFAAFPQEWPRRLILGWSPSGVCVACGEGRRPVVERTPMEVRPSTRRLTAQATGNASRTATGGTMTKAPEATITGYACACPDASAPTRPSVVIDPFGGTGTVAGVARQLGRFGVSFDLSHDYCRLAQWFLRDGKRFAKSASRTDAERQGSLL